jgi:TRAP transporter 4TM/12TM fusion protein
MTQTPADASRRRQTRPRSRNGRADARLRPGRQQLVFWGCVAFTTFHLYVLNLRPMEPWLFRSVHVSFGTALGFLMMYSGRVGEGRPRRALVRLGADGASIACFVYIFIHLDGSCCSAPAPRPHRDVVIGIIGTLLVLEITRRSAGLALPIIAIIFLCTASSGRGCRACCTTAASNFDLLFSYVYSMEGVFGPTTAVSSTYIILFITFAGFLQVSKVGDYFINFAFAIAGRARGGPAKVAVLSSALMGTINGTSAGNVAATGTFTIPLMKKVGYPPRSAGAIEAAASTGGQIMPPVMGAGVFIMAEITGIPYTELMIAAALPALLYFVAVLLHGRQRGASA